MATLTNTSKVDNAIRLYKDAQNMYFGIGRSKTPWKDEQNPDVPQSTQSKIDELVGMKRVTDVSLAVKLDSNKDIAGRNYIINSSGVNTNSGSKPYLKGASVAVSNSTLSYQSDAMTLTYTGNGTQEWYYALAEAYANMSDSLLDFSNTYTISVDVMGTVPGAAFRVNNVFSSQVKINNKTWTRLTYTFTFPIMSGTNASKFYIRLNAMNGTDTSFSGFSSGQTLRFKNFKLEKGSIATPWTASLEETYPSIAQSGENLVAYNGDYYVITGIADAYRVNANYVYIASKILQTDFDEKKFRSIGIFKEPVFTSGVVGTVVPSSNVVNQGRLQLIENVQLVDRTGMDILEYAIIKA